MHRGQLVTLVSQRRALAWKCHGVQRRTHRQRSDSDVGSGTATRLNRVTRVSCRRQRLVEDICGYHGALALLSMGDFFVEVKKPSEKATEGLYQTLSLSAKAIENSAKRDTLWPDGEVKLLSDQVLGSVGVAEACGGHVNLEPHFTDAPWKMTLFTQAIAQTSLAKYIEVPESCSARVDEMREMASTIKTEVRTDLNATRERLHRTADLVPICTPSAEETLGMWLKDMAEMFEGGLQSEKDMEAEGRCQRYHP